MQEWFIITFVQKSQGCRDNIGKFGVDILNYEEMEEAIGKTRPVNPRLANLWQSLGCQGFKKLRDWVRRPNKEDCTTFSNGIRYTVTYKFGFKPLLEIR